MTKYYEDPEMGVIVAVTDDGFVGSAKCHPNDEWQPLIGRHLALARAYMDKSSKAHKHARNLHRMAYDMIDNKERINGYVKATR